MMLLYLDCGTSVILPAPTQTEAAQKVLMGFGDNHYAATREYTRFTHGRLSKADPCKQFYPDLRIRRFSGAQVWVSRKSHGSQLLKVGNGKLCPKETLPKGFIWLWVKTLCPW